MKFGAFLVKITGKGDVRMSVTKNAKTGKWDCQIWYKDWQGKRKHTTRTGFAREKDAKAFEREFLQKKQRQDPTIDLAIGEYKNYLANERKLKNIKQTTYEHKIDYLDRCILPYFQGVKISKITEVQVNEWLAHMSTSSKLKKRLGSGTLNIYRATLKQLFDFCKIQYRYEHNPAKQIKRVKKFSNDERVDYWTLEQYQQFYNSLRNDTLRILFNIIFWSGLRIGECLSLTPADFKPYKICITRSTETTKECGQLEDTPKNEYSTREVEIPRALYMQIMDYIKSVYDVKPDTKLFAQYTSSAIRNQIYYHGNKKLGLPKASTHTLRHTYASLLYSTSHDITVVAKQIGHGDIHTTLKYYAHMMDDKDRQAVDILEQKVNEQQKSAKEEVLDAFETNFELLQESKSSKTH